MRSIECVDLDKVGLVVMSTACFLSRTVIRVNGTAEVNGMLKLNGTVLMRTIEGNRMIGRDDGVCFRQYVRSR